MTVAGYTVDSVEVVGVNDADSDPVKEAPQDEYILITLTDDLAKNAAPERVCEWRGGRCGQRQSGSTSNQG